MFFLRKPPLGAIKAAMALTGFLALAASAAAPVADAGTYPMYQCGAGGTTAVAPGWSAYGFNTNASTVLSNSCSSAGTIGVYVFSHGQSGAVEENGSSGSQVGLALNVPGSAPDVTIQSMSAQAIASSVQGNDAFFGFSSAGQSLPGLVELVDGGAGYSAGKNWTLPQGARDFEAFVNCTTDHSSTNCYFANSTQVPALNNITLTLVDGVSPTITNVSGTLASAAAHGSTGAGEETLSFTGSDTDSGVRSATVTLTPQGSGSPFTKTIDFSAQCPYNSWNACPVTQNANGVTVDTASLKDDSYAVSLTVTDAGGNVASDSLGTVATHNAPTSSAPPTVTGSPIVGQTLTATPGTVSSNPGAGSLTVVGQWFRCDGSGANCQPIPGSTGTSYNLTASDIATTIRYRETVSNNDGSVVGQSASLGPIQHSGETKEEREAREAKEASGSNGSNGANGANGAAGSGGSNGSAATNGLTINLNPGGSTSGSSVLFGSASRWSISLSVSPRKVRRRSMIKLSGRVATSPRPGNGKLVYLQARSLGQVSKRVGRRRRKVLVYGKWVTFQALRAKSNGTFASTYKFRLGGRHTYQFQAVAPAEGQYRNPTGISKAIAISEV
jgi:hypothetical protein